MYTKYPWPTAGFILAPLLTRHEDAEKVSDRQDRVPGFSTSALSRTRLLLIGAGGLGGAVASALTRKGIGELRICDPDVVEVTNLNRQHFYRTDLHKPKAIRLADNAVREGELGSLCVGHHVAFSAETAAALSNQIDVVVCGVDNNATRAAASHYFRRQKIPVIFTAVSDDASFGWSFVQEAEGACLACVFPTMAEAESKRQHCRAVPAVIDILQVMGGIVLYAVDSLVMPRQRHWNFRSVHLAGGSPDCVSTVPPRPDCRLCGGDVSGFSSKEAS